MIVYVPQGRHGPSYLQCKLIGSTHQPSTAVPTGLAQQGFMDSRREANLQLQHVLATEVCRPAHRLTTSQGQSPPNPITALHTGNDKLMQRPEPQRGIPTAILNMLDPPEPANSRVATPVTINTRDEEGMPSGFYPTSGVWLQTSDLPSGWDSDDSRVSWDSQSGMPIFKRD